MLDASQTLQNGYAERVVYVIKMVDIARLRTRISFQATQSYVANHKASGGNYEQCFLTQD